MRRALEAVVDEDRAGRLRAPPHADYSMQSAIRKHANSAAAQKAAAELKEQRSRASFDAAWAVLGGRFGTPQAALRHQRTDADLKETREYYKKLKVEHSNVAQAKADEARRLLHLRQASSNQPLSQELRQDLSFQEDKFNQLLQLSDTDVLNLTDKTIEDYR